MSSKLKLSLDYIISPYMTRHLSAQSQHFYGMMSSPSSSSYTNPPTNVLAAAAERRAMLLKQTDHLTEAEQHEKRQSFRRLIDPGIIRPNTQEVATASLKVCVLLVYSHLNLCFSL
jgi:hypothetical protein